jgi:ABC-type proline/glycine betaine transport system substrate-binding protein
MSARLCDMHRQKKIVKKETETESPSLTAVFQNANSSYATLHREMIMIMSDKNESC